MSQISAGPLSGPTDPDQKFSRPEAAHYLGISTRHSKAGPSAAAGRGC